MFKKDVILAQEYLGFLLLNLFDLFLTGYLFKYEGQEANGIALFVLHHFGKRGFAVFKFMMLVFIVFICELISFYNIKRARQVITAACILYVLLVFYEAYLIFTYVNPELEHPHPPIPTSYLATRFRLALLGGV